LGWEKKKKGIGRRGGEFWGVIWGGIKKRGGERKIRKKKKRGGGKTKWTGHIMCRNCLLIHITEGQMEGRIEVM